MTNPLFDALFAPHMGRDTSFLVLPNGDRLSHAAFLHRAAQFAHVLTGRGLRPGDRLAAQIPKSADALALYAACVQAGIVFLPLNTAYTVQELSYFIEDSGARLVVCDPAAREGLTEIAQRCDAQLESLGARGDGSLIECAALQPDDFATVARTGGDLAALLYTSGTTGRSKGAMLSQDNLLSNARALAQAWQFTDQDVLLHALPIFHTHGLFVATNVTLLAGGAMLFLPTFDAAEMLRLMPQANTMMGVPTFYTRLLEQPAFDRDLTAHMRLFVSGSAPLLAETHRAFEARTGHRILERYGMTETNMNSTNPYEGDRRAGTVGRPLPGVEIKITDPATGERLPTGAIGQIEVRGPNVFLGYWQMSQKTAEELRADGFFITGDLGRFDADGYLTIVGRNKDLIISGGYNIYPKEVELVLDACPGVVESAVIGVPHADFGEAVLAVIVPEPGTALDPEDLLDVARAELARFKLPRQIVVVDALPRNTMGKVQKNVLRDTYAAHLT